MSTEQGQSYSLLDLGVGLEKSSRLASRLGLEVARLGSSQLASLMRAEPSLFLWLVKTPSRAEPARSGSRARPNMAQAGPEGKSYLIPYLLQSARSHGLKDAGDMHHVMCELVIFQLHNIYILILDDANDVNMARTLCCCPSTAAREPHTSRAEPHRPARSKAEPSLARLAHVPSRTEPSRAWLGSARFQP